MDINYGDIIVLNSELKRKNLRYHVSYKNEELNEKTLECIQDYYKKKNITVHFTEDGLYFSCEES